MAKKKSTAKKAGKKAKRKQTGTEPVVAKKSPSVRVRMYCQGLGDCFLLTFVRAGGEFNMLIDCGVILGTPHAAERVTEVAQHLADTLPKNREGKPLLDLLVGTHEHWDHVSGFVQADQIFDQFDIRQTWLAWTEDPHDDLANKLRREREEKKKKLALAIDHFRGLAPGDDDDELPTAPRQRLAGLASFLGVESALNAAAGMGRTAQAMQFFQRQKPQFLRPGQQPPALDGLAGVEVFVLGPPRDEKLLKKDLPSKSEHEVYEEPAHAHGLTALFGLDVPDGSGRHENQPFEARYSMPLAAAISDPYFAQMYDNGLDEHPAAWRRIDDVGMFAATDLALQLDADTNNTSLVLAIRLPGGQVLLFPGDAQVGNWESWHKIEFDDKQIKASDLLAATVIYKVGHHGSHNATLSKLGLDLMTSPQLVAMLPVDEDIAHNNKGWLRMPFVPLMTELHRRTNGRILRVDHEVPHPLTDLAAGSEPAWTASAEKFITDPQRSLYLEIIVE